MGQAQSMNTKPLRGCVVKVVDGRGNADFDAAKALGSCCRHLGAQVCVAQRLVKNLTHVVVVQGHDDHELGETLVNLQARARKV